MCLVKTIASSVDRHGILSTMKLPRHFLVLLISRVVARIYGHVKLPLAVIGGKPANQQAGKYEGEVM